MAKLKGKLGCTLNLTIRYCTPSAQPDMSKDRQKTVVLWRCNTPKLPPQMGEMNKADLRGNEPPFLILFEIGEEGTPRQIFSNIRHNFSANELASATVQSFEHKKWNPLYWTRDRRNDFSQTPISPKSPPNGGRAIFPPLAKICQFCFTQEIKSNLNFAPKVFQTTKTNW